MFNKDEIKHRYRLLVEEGIIDLSFSIVFFILISAILFTVVEPKPQHITYLNFFIDNIWLTVVTMTTVGYGDIVPKTATGKVIATFIMIFGVVYVSIFTAKIASIFVNINIKKSKGLANVMADKHFVICGWNHNGFKTIKSILYFLKKENRKLVLINSLSEEQIQEIKERFSDIVIEFVRGNFSKESVLRKANIEKADNVIILADISGERDFEKVDSKSIFAALAIKNIDSNIKICTELLFSENIQHLKNANVDEYIVSGEYSGYLLAQSAISPGITEAIRDLITIESGNFLSRKRIPNSFINKKYIELFEYFKKNKILLIGIVSEETLIGIDDILSEDSSSIDEFIRKKFEESNKNLDDTTKYKVNINLEDDYIIKKNDHALVISTEV